MGTSKYSACRERREDFSSDEIKFLRVVYPTRMYKDTMMPSPENPEDPELEEKKSNVLDAYRLEIYTLLRILKQSNVAEYRDLADYYTALMYRFNFRTDALSPEESYVIGTELLAMGRIMGNPYANRYLKMFDLFRYEDEDDDTEDEDDSGDIKS